jgi:hypothetical protein
MSKEKMKDTGYALTKGLIGSIPFAGAVGSELFSLIVRSPLENRQETWMEDIGNRLLLLEQKKFLDLRDLQSNEQFIDIVSRATGLAIKTSDGEKLQAFRNAVLNTAAGEAPSKTVSELFLNLIDGFTSWHIKILSLFNDPPVWFKLQGKRFPDAYLGSLFLVVTSAFPELEGQADLAELIWSDLQRAGLHNSSGLRTGMTGDGLTASRTTNLGKEFLRFIMEQPN